MAIVRHLVLGGGDLPQTRRATIEELARRTGHHPNTVASRIRRLSDIQAFLPMTVQVAATPFGLELAHVFLPVPPDRRTPELEAAAHGLAGLHYMIHYLEGWTLILYGRSREHIAQAVRPIERAAGVSAQWDIVMSRDFPPLEAAEPDSLDLRLLGALVQDSRRGLRELAGHLAVPIRTLRRRHERIFHKQWARYVPGPVGRVAGMVFGYVLFDLPEGATRSQAIAAMRPYVHASWSGRVFERKAHFWPYAESIGDLQSCVAGLRAIPGISNLQARTMERMTVHRRLGPTLIRWIQGPSGDRAAAAQPIAIEGGSGAE